MVAGTTIGIVKLLVEFDEDRGHKDNEVEERPFHRLTTRPSAGSLPRSRPGIGAHVPNDTPPPVTDAVVDNGIGRQSLVVGRQKLPYLLGKLLDVDRLHDVAVEPGAQEPRSIVAHCEGRQCNHRDGDRARICSEVA